MKGELQKRRILGRGKEVFVGVDVHKESWHDTARMEGQEVFHGDIPSQYHALQRIFDHKKTMWPGRLRVSSCFMGFVLPLLRDMDGVGIIFNG
jgi:hypothetical protein